MREEPLAKAKPFDIPKPAVWEPSRSEHAFQVSRFAHRLVGQGLTHLGGHAVRNGNCSRRYGISESLAPVVVQKVPALANFSFDTGNFDSSHCDEPR